MILPIVLYGSPVLEKVSDIIPKDYSLEELIRNMYETLRSTKGAGLAAVQVGVPYRLFITDYTLDTGEDFTKVFINPKIIRTWGRISFESEGCLSFPGITAQVERKFKVELAYEDINGKHYTTIFSGIKARIIQHEMDHVEGRYFIDNLGYVDRMALSEQLKKIKNRDIKIHYNFI